MSPQSHIGEFIKYTYYLFINLRYPDPKSSHLDLQILQHPSRNTYNAFAAYGSSKLCCLLLTQHLHRQYIGDGVSFNAVHPGNLLPTQLMRKASCMYKLLRLIVQPLTSSVVSSVQYNTLNFDLLCLASSSFKYCVLCSSSINGGY